MPSSDKNFESFIDSNSNNTNSDFASQLQLYERFESALIN